MEADLAPDLFERLARPPLSQAPHEVLGPLRRRPPPRLRTGQVVLARHEDVVTALRDPRFEKPALPWLPFRSVQTLFRMFLMLNAPDHLRLRRVVAPLIAPGAVAARRERVHAQAAALLDGRRTIDVVAEFAYPFPLAVIGEAVGAGSDRERVAAVAATLTQALDNPLPLSPSLSALPRFVAAVATRRARPLATLMAAREIVAIARGRLLAADAPDGADVLVALRAAHESGAMSLDEAVATWVLMVIAGHETTANLIGNALFTLLRHPEQMAAVTDDFSLVPRVVEETLRYESPVPMAARVPSADIEMSGRTISAGTQSVIVLAAANRDPEVFPRADHFDIFRDASEHLAFGHGSHFCIGVHLARLEAEIALTSLLARRPVLDTGRQPRWRDTFATRGLAHLEVRFTV